MKLQTQIPLQESTFQINYSSSVLLLGSCFAENIGDKFSYFKFQSLTNPFGILFHPKAIEKLIENAILGKQYDDKDVFKHYERWHCFNAHSSLSDVSKEQVLRKLNVAVKETKQQIRLATHIVITLGTAWVYMHKKSGAIVANCHKVPQKEFHKKILSIAEIESSLYKIMKLVQSVNSNVKFIFTISPVRHIKDGFVENQRSKSHLITAMHSVLNKLNLEENKVSYFPSYEIMMDELRDYRFYDMDMLHPNRLAIDYIWEKFSNSWLTKEAISTAEKVATVQKGLHHRPFNAKSASHQKFIASLQEKITYLQKEYPFMKF